MDANKDSLGIDGIVVGGESAGGGLAAAVCMLARDKGEIKVDMQLPLYPMLDCDDTPSSSNNRGLFWNTRKNRKAWKKYLGELYQSENVPAYASPSKAKDYSNLPKCYTFVCEGEPFYCETLEYVKNLKNVGVKADVDVYPGRIHAFDMLFPYFKRSREARRKIAAVFKEFLKERGKL